MSDHQKEIEAAISAATEVADQKTTRQWALDLGAELEKRGLAILPSYYKLTGGENHELKDEGEFIALIKFHAGNCSFGNYSKTLDRVNELIEALRRRSKRSSERV